VLALGALLCASAARRERRWPRSARAWLRAAALVVASVLGLLVSVLYALPTLAVIPPEQIARGATVGTRSRAVEDARAGGHGGARPLSVHGGVVRLLPQPELAPAA
jgi:hypothetical protein